MGSFLGRLHGIQKFVQAQYYLCNLVPFVPPQQQKVFASFLLLHKCGHCFYCSYYYQIITYVPLLFFF